MLNRSETVVYILYLRDETVNLIIYIKLQEWEGSENSGEKV